MARKTQQAKTTKRIYRYLTYNTPITNSEIDLKMRKRLEIDKGLLIGKSNLDAEPGNQFRVCLWN